MSRSSGSAAVEPLWNAPGGAPGTADDPAPAMLAVARQMQSMRAKAVRYFPRDTMRHCEWDIMLELYVARLENRIVCIKELVIASRETSTSALRRIDRLEAAGMLLRSPHFVDHRRVAVALTTKGSEAMTAMLRGLLPPDPCSAEQDAGWDAGPGRSNGRERRQGRSG